MTARLVEFDELADLVWALTNERLDPPGSARLQQLLDRDAANRRVYIQLMDQFAALEWEKGEGGQSNDEGGTINDESSSARSETPVATRSETPVSECMLSGNVPKPESNCERDTADEGPAIHPSSFILYPFWYLGTPLVCYTIAALLIGGGMFLVAAWKADARGPRGVAQSTVRQTPAVVEIAATKPKAVSVGKITAMNNCRWADPKLAARVGQDVFVGQKYLIVEGATLEITYAIGPVVTLRGPAGYEVDARDGGFLWFGKLSARVVDKEGKRKLPAGTRLKAASDSEVLGQEAPAEVALHPFFVIRSTDPARPNAMLSEPGGEFTLHVTQGGMEGYVVKSPVWLHLSHSERLKMMYLNDSIAVGVDAKGESWVAAGRGLRPAESKWEMPRSATASAKERKTENQVPEQKKRRSGSPDS
jgi:hypothetical protein